MNASKIFLTALAFGLMTGVFTSASAQSEQVIDVMGYTSQPTFQSKLESALSDLQAGGYNKVLYIRGGFDGQYVLNSPVEVDTGGYRLKWKCDPSVVINYAGSGSAITFRGLRNSRIDNLNIRLTGTGAAGIEMTGHSTRVIFNGCNVEITSNAANTRNIGILINGASDTQNGNGTYTQYDISFVEFKLCHVGYEEHNNISDNFTGTHMGDIANSGNIGFGVLGGDFMANVFDQCTTYKMRIGFSQMPQAGITPVGANASAGGAVSYRDCSASYCYVGWHLPPNGRVALFGGRSENSGCYIVMAPEYGNTDPWWNGNLSLTGVDFDNSRIPVGVASPLYDHSAQSKGVLIYVNSCAAVAVTGSAFNLGNPNNTALNGSLAGGSDVFRLRAHPLTKTFTPPGDYSLNLSRKPVLVLLGNTVRNQTIRWDGSSTNWSEASNNWVLAGRQWAVNVDGIQMIGADM